MAEAEAEAAKKIASTLCCMCCCLCCCAAIVAAAAAKTASNSSPSRAEQQLCCARARSRSLGCFGCFGCGALSCSRCLGFYILLLFLLLLLLFLLSIRLRPHLPACLGCPASGTVQARSLLVALSRFLSHSLHSLAHSHAAALLLSQSTSLPASLLLSFAQRIGL